MTMPNKYSIAKEEKTQTISKSFLIKNFNLLFIIYFILD